MTYPQALAYLSSFVNYEKIPAWVYKKSFSLERFSDFLQTIGNPQASLRCIHVAGTKGKGSTCAFCAYILREAGLRVGLYTSPHLVDFRERIRILKPQSHNRADDFEGMIPKSELARLVAPIKPLVDAYNRSLQKDSLTLFEVYTAIAFLYFKQKKVDFAILETGLGGRLDATNTVQPLVCVITPVSYEHTDKLGSRLSDIAREKAGIIKDHPCIVVNAPQAAESGRAIKHACKERGVVLFQVGKDITYEVGEGSFTVQGIFERYGGLTTRLPGAHQIQNAASAIGAIECLRLSGLRVPKAAVSMGVRATRWPGRCEVISRKPMVVLDGAQNGASARVLATTVRQNFKFNKLILVLGISRDKDKASICRHLRSLADTVILTQANNPRATPPRDLLRYFKGKQVHMINSVSEAKRFAHQKAGRDDCILVCGSLFVVGEFRQ